MKLFAWTAFVFAVIAGAGLAATAAALVQLIVMLAALTVLIVDIAKDRTPNQGAVLVAVALPALIVGMQGRLAHTISGLLNSLWKTVQGTLGDWAGTQATLFIAVAAVVVSFLISTRVVARSGSFR